eukprot:m.140436 g.140436  ORF g.140436 m.140436 type:complete len:1428 (-) comp14034_c0_seq4:366-4649(-)
MSCHVRPHIHSHSHSHRRRQQPCTCITLNSGVVLKRTQLPLHATFGNRFSSLPVCPFLPLASLATKARAIVVRSKYRPAKAGAGPGVSHLRNRKMAGGATACKALFFTNGSQHDRGLKIVVSTRKYPTMDMLKEELTRRLNTRNAVRSIFHVLSRTPISDVTDVKEGEAYACAAGKERYVDLAYGRANYAPTAQDKKGHNTHAARKKRVHSQGHVSDKHHTAVPEVKATIVTMFNNSDSACKGKPFVVNARTATSMQQVLDAVSELTPIAGGVHKLVKLDGHRIRSVDDLYMNHHLIACGKEKVNRVLLAQVRVQHMSKTSPYSPSMPRAKVASASQHKLTRAENPPSAQGSQQYLAPPLTPSDKGKSFPGVVALPQLHNASNQGSPRTSPCLPKKSSYHGGVRKSQEQVSIKGLPSPRGSFSGNPSSILPGIASRGQTPSASSTTSGDVVDANGDDDELPSSSVFVADDQQDTLVEAGEVDGSSSSVTVAATAVSSPAKPTPHNLVRVDYLLSEADEVQKRHHLERRRQQASVKLKVGRSLQHSDAIIQHFEEGEASLQSKLQEEKERQLTIFRSKLADKQRQGSATLPPISSRNGSASPLGGRSPIPGATSKIGSTTHLRPITPIAASKAESKQGQEQTASASSSPPSPSSSLLPSTSAAEGSASTTPVPPNEALPITLEQHQSKTPTPTSTAPVAIAGGPGSAVDVKPSGTSMTDMQGNNGVVSDGPISDTALAASKQQRGSISAISREHAARRSSAVESAPPSRPLTPLERTTVQRRKSMEPQLDAVSETQALKPSPLDIVVSHTSMDSENAPGLSDVMGVDARPLSGIAEEQSTVSSTPPSLQTLKDEQQKLPNTSKEPKARDDQRTVVKQQVESTVNGLTPTSDSTKALFQQAAGDTSIDEGSGAVAKPSAVATADKTTPQNSPSGVAATDTAATAPQTIAPTTTTTPLATTEESEKTTATVDTDVRLTEGIARPRTPDFFRRASSSLLRRNSKGEYVVVTPDLEVSKSMVDMLKGISAVKIQAYYRGYRVRKQYGFHKPRTPPSKKQPANPVRTLEGRYGSSATVSKPMARRPYKPVLPAKYSVDETMIEETYTIHEQLGDGNFAEVYRCTRNDSGMEYAIKVVDKARLIGRREKKMVQQEVEIMQRVDHPHIIKLFYTHETKTNIYLVLELVKGGDLFDRVVEAGRFTEADASKLIHHLASAVAYLHSMNIVHRDLKPENILVAQDELGNDVLKLADFGLSMVVTEKLYTVCGTPTYVAPEIVSEDGDGYGLEIDAWAMGVITYIMLSGIPPFTSPKKNQKELFRRICAGKLSFPDQYWQNVSEEAKSLIRQLLRTDPSKRLTPAGALRHGWVNHTPASASTCDRQEPVVRELLHHFPPKERWSRTVSIMRMLSQEEKDAIVNAPIIPATLSEDGGDPA